MSSHVHRFHRLTFVRLPLTRWHCSCGLKVSTAIARLLEGR